MIYDYDRDYTARIMLRMLYYMSQLQKYTQQKQDKNNHWLRRWWADVNVNHYYYASFSEDTTDKKELQRIADSMKKIYDAEEIKKRKKELLNLHNNQHLEAHFTNVGLTH